jgi:hypothetical protein
VGVLLVVARSPVRLQKNTQPADLVGELRAGGRGIDPDGELAFTWTEADPDMAPNYANLADNALKIGRNSN